MPSTRLYWSKEFYFEKVAGTMPVNRYEKIKKFLHCSDNQTRPKNCTVRLYKIRSLVDHLQKQFSNLKPSELLCIDEQIVPFKGKSGLKQYNPKKPKKWGYKLYVLSGIDGLIYNFQVHTDAIDVCLNQPNLKASGNIVLTLLQHIPRNKWAIKWFDNRGVTLLSTYESVNPVSNVSRLDRKANKRVNVVGPSIVTTYNMFMGGVDLLDGFLSLHRISIRSKKWYHKLLFHFFDMVVVQSWILYRRQNEGNTLKLSSK
ncbi:piggyBac transposable element-derived protein 3-like [Hydra vulgaris]|uniref:PiggyBac transposable element-derived protein 3-like n=1 Tax=Hydra vulgaris TaxID=6087 RepID=A0ABM4DMS3_HYDVU